MQFLQFAISRAFVLKVRDFFITLQHDNNNRDNYTRRAPTLLDVE